MFNEQFGLNRPFIVRFLEYLKNIFLHLDFGESYRTHNAVITSIAGRITPTLIVAVFGVLTSLLIGIPLGVLSAIRRSTLTDSSVTVLALFLAAIPSFWLGLMLLQVFSIQLRWLPSHGAATLDGVYIACAGAVHTPVRRDLSG